jgi:rhodanese-related sulfurtransferase
MEDQKSDLARRILRVEEAPKIYNQGFPEITSKANCSTLGIEGTADQRRRDLCFLGKEEFEKHLGEACMSLATKQESKRKTRSGNAVKLDAQLVYELFALEFTVVPASFLHRKEFWSFLKSILGSNSLRKFVDECDEYWLENHPIPECVYQKWQAAANNYMLVGELLREFPCLMEAFIAFALKNKKWKEIYLEACIQPLDKCEQEAKQRQKQQLEKSVSMMKQQAVSTVCRHGIQTENAHMLLQQIGIEMQKQNVAMQSVNQAKCVYGLLEKQRSVLAGLVQGFQHQSLEQMQDAILAVQKQVQQQVTESLAYLKTLNQALPDPVWNQLSGMIETKNCQHASMMINSAIKMQQMGSKLL